VVRIINLQVGGKLIKNRPQGNTMGSIKTIFLALVVVGIILIVAAVILPGSSPSREGVGALNTAHLHVDFLVVMDGERIDFNQPRYMVRSPYTHVEGDTVGGAGDIMHVHAVGVPLSLFFESVNMNFNSECFRLDDGREFCNEGNNKIQLFVNGQKNTQYGQYVPKDLDKVLIIYGDYTDAELEEQIDNVPDFARVASLVG
jgi:type II secretory pathway pseudopilin PulG